MPPRPRRDRPTDRPTSPPAGAGAAGGKPGAGAAAAADDVRRFAELVRSQQAREKARVADDRRRATEVRQRADDAAADERRLAYARQAKERAARRLKEARSSRSNAAVAEAEDGYKQALADLLALETGERPSWAPPVPEPDPEPDAALEPASEPDADVAPEPAADAVVEPEA